MPPMPPMRFIIFIRPPPFIFFIIPCICSMTPLERRKPDLIKATRKRRIAAGAGVQVQEVNRLLNQFDQMQGMMKKMKGGGLMKMMKRMGGMKGMPKF